MSEETMETLDSQNEDLLETANIGEENDDSTGESEDASGDTGYESSEDPRDAKIQELEEKLKEKSIKDRIKAKKSSKEESVSPDLEQRLIQSELRAEGVKDPKDMETVMHAAKVLGVEPIDALSDPFVQERLARSQKQRTAVNAVPGASSRQTVNIKANTDYWIKKGELPPKEDVELRRKVVNKRTEMAKHQKKFNN